MRRNIHPIERVIRIVAGLILGSLAFWGPCSLWFLIGFIIAFTGLIGWCPPYELLGVNTCRGKDKK